jgi:hypothetical protein
MIVKLTPASDDRRVWMVSTSLDQKRSVPVDFMTAPEEQRSFLGSDVGYYEAEPAEDGWNIMRRVDRQPW